MKGVLLEEFDFYDHLGGHSPYFLSDDQGHFFHRMSQAIATIPEKNRKIDPVGVVEFISRGYLLAGRTLVTGIERSPWMARPQESGQWQYAVLPEHGVARPKVPDHVHCLKAALHREALGYVTGKGVIGILLSGGLDSRIVAGILRELQLDREFDGQVVALTWGVKHCRDVKYAQEIAKRFSWDWLHLPLSAEQFRENIKIAGEMGAEFAPIHLHSMPQLAKMQGLDAVLAGSYGDSVGRAEFSGVRLQKLRPSLTANIDPFAIVRANVVAAARPQIHEDCYGYRRHLHREYEYQYREIEQQMHYMRRRNQSPMTCIHEKIPLFQMFTAPTTFGLMWGLDPGLRDDRFYAALLPTLPGNIGEIPWARNGLPLGGEITEADATPKEHHRYGIWLRQDLRDEVVALVTGEAISSLGIFDERALKRLLGIWSHSGTASTSHVDEIISWLASLSLFVDSCHIVRCNDIPADGNSNHLRFLVGGMRAAAYLTARELLRN